MIAAIFRLSASRRWPGLVLLIATMTACIRSDLAPPQAAAAPAPTSGYNYQSADTQALQDDTFANPGYLWVDRGRQLFVHSDAGAPACASCHDSDNEEFRAAATRFPRFDRRTNTLVNLGQQINRCRVEQQQRPALDYESDDLLALSAYVTEQAKGLPFDVDVTGLATQGFEAGRDYFYKRRGQLNLACHHCHDWNAGRKLRGNTISEGHSNGYPAYRLEWQAIGSLHRRLQMCNVGVRAEPFAGGDQRYVELELFLAWRAGKLPLEAPAVRR